jgi:hypothetical protein
MSCPSAATDSPDLLRYGNIARLAGPTGCGAWLPHQLFMRSQELCWEQYEMRLD